MGKSNLFEKKKNPIIEFYEHHKIRQRNKKKVESCRFFEFEMFNFDLQRISVAGQSKELHQFARAEQKKLFISENYLGSALVGLLATDQFLRHVLSFYSIFDVKKFESKTFGDVVVWVKRSPFSAIEGLKENLTDLNTIRNNLVIHPKAAQFYEYSAKKRIFRLTKTDLYEQIAEDVLYKSSAVESSFQQLFEKAYGPPVFYQNGEKRYHSLHRFGSLDSLLSADDGKSFQSEKIE